MSNYETLEARRQNLIRQIEQLPPMRIGTLQQQYLPRKRKDGSVVRRGPYWTYTFKRDGKTCGKHLNDDQAALYAGQVEACRRFRTLCEEILLVSQQMAELTMGASAAKKNSKSGSTRKRARKPSAS